MSARRVPVARNLEQVRALPDTETPERTRAYWREGLAALKALLEG